jgi:hypothetical protein
MKKERSKRRPRRFWTPKEDELLGKASDAEIGADLGAPNLRFSKGAETCT